METKKYTGQVVDCLISNEARKATKFVNDKLVIKASRRTYKHLKGKFDKRTIEIVLTIGKPNYEEREFIKKCKKANEPFPVKKIQLKFFKK